MKQCGLFLMVSFVLILSCKTGPQSPDPEFPLDLTEADEPAPFFEEILPEEQAFDPDSVSEELFKATKTDIQAFIKELDNTIRARNYNVWLEYLSESYLLTISSPTFLESRTEELHKRNQAVAAAMGRDPRTVQKRELKTPRDYFDNVVVPSRANDRVDDIAFISETKVRAYTVAGGGTRLILYDLEIIGGIWKIIG